MNLLKRLKGVAKDIATCKALCLAGEPKLEGTILTIMDDVIAVVTALAEKSESGKVQMFVVQGKNNNSPDTDYRTLSLGALWNRSAANDAIATYQKTHCDELGIDAQFRILTVELPCVDEVSDYIAMTPWYERHANTM